MPVSGTRAFKMTLYNIVDSALHKIGGNSAKAAEFLAAKTQLNLIMSDLQNQGQQLWTRQDDLIPLVDGTIKYTLDASAIDVDNVFFRHEDSDVPLDSYTRQDYSDVSTKKSEGDPNRFYIDWQLAAPTMSLYPVYGYNTGFVLGTDGKYYICKASHTSAAASRPITGADYATCWEEVTFKTTATVWVTATVYDSGHVRFTKILRAQDILANATDPDAPVRWQNALVWLLADALAPDYGLQAWERKDLTQRAAFALASAQAGNRESADLHIYPRMRR
jgi:hypothetical protein